MAIMAPMNDCMFKVVPVMRSMIMTPEITAGIVESTTRDRRMDWKFADNRRKITRNEKYVSGYRAYCVQFISS